MLPRSVANNGVSQKKQAAKPQNHSTERPNEARQRTFHKLCLPNEPSSDCTDCPWGNIHTAVQESPFVLTLRSTLPAGRRRQMSYTKMLGMLWSPNSQMAAPSAHIKILLPTVWYESNNSLTCICPAPNVDGGFQPFLNTTST